MVVRLFGRAIQIGKTSETKPVVREKGISDYGGGFLDFFRTSLSSEKEISTKLLRAYEEWVYVNVSTLAETVSSMEFELFQFKLVKGQLELEPIGQHEILDLLDKFNANTTRADAIYNTQAHLDLAGDSFWLLEGGKNNQKPEAIFLLQPDSIALDLVADKASGIKLRAYDYKITVDGKEVTRSYNPEEIIHIKVPNPTNQYRGKSAVEALATTIDTDNYAQEALKQLFKNGMIGDFFLSTDKRITPDQLKNLAAQFKAAYTGVKNFWKIPILSGGIKPEKLMHTGREMQLIELEEWLRNKIMSAFKNTRASLGIDDEVNRSTAEASLANWKRSVIAPKMARIVNALNEYLVPRYGDNLILGFKDPVPEDRDGEIKEATELFKAKIITKNEARQIVGYDAVEGGDEFEVSVSPLATDFGKQLISRVPALKYVNYARPLRKAGIYKAAKEFQRLKREALPLAKQLVHAKRNGKKDTTEEVREHGRFTNEQVWNYWEKQIDLVDDREQIFLNMAEQYVNAVVDEGLRNLDDRSRRERGDLLDKDEMLTLAIHKFTPILNEVMILSGQIANLLIGLDEPYIPTKAIDTREAIREQILRFAGSILETDLDLMTEILASGLDEGLSIAQIRRAMQEKFATFSKTQAERITRTEVLKASNLGAQDAFEQSGVVVAKQWLTAMDDRVDPLCASLNGKIISLEVNFFKKGQTIEAGDKSMKLDYSDTPYPPLHPSCRCTILPVVKGQEDFDVRSFELFQDLKAQIAELEDKADKRTREYKEMKQRFEDSQKSLEDTEKYAKELEKLAGIGDEK